ncbi:hypothetical protein SE18_17160 [Herpetosiphon geysericola]|uniref:Uncharacterized protein n=1 Tax=Herpetosiphon geysericola TaxID=70996 RepID=A0A0P6Y0C2_9CHLR|nr:hypothetical protein SE18_17160 [Herpetosiphon geysericola]
MRDESWRSQKSKSLFNREEREGHEEIFLIRLLSKGCGSTKNQSRKSVLICGKKLSLLALRALRGFVLRVLRALRGSK